MGSHAQRQRAAPRAPCHAGDRLLFLQHQHGERFLEPSRRRSTRSGRCMDAAALGRRPDACRRIWRSQAQVRTLRSVSSWSRREWPTVARSTWRPEPPSCLAARTSWADGRPRSKAPGRYQVEFANVDDRVSLIVDGRAVGGRDSSSPGRNRSRFRPRPTCRRRPSASQRLGRRERPCPEARYLLYPVPWPARLRSGLGRALSPDAGRAIRLSFRSLPISPSGQREIA